MFFTCLIELCTQNLAAVKGVGIPQPGGCPSFPLPRAPPALDISMQKIRQETLPNFHIYHAVSEANGSGGCSRQSWQRSCQQFSHNLGASAARLVVMNVPKLELSCSLLPLPTFVPRLPSCRPLHLGL